MSTLTNKEKVLSIYAKKLANTKFLNGQTITEEDMKVYFTLQDYKDAILNFNNPKFLQWYELIDAYNQ